jgi:type III secretory pathway component EscS
MWFVPLVGALLFPETPLIRAVLYGLILSLFVAVDFRAARTVKKFRLRFLIVVVLLAVLAGLLIGVL